MVREIFILDYYIFDYWFVICWLNFDKFRVIKKIVIFRKIKGVDLGVFFDEILLLDLCVNILDILNDFVLCYNFIFLFVLDWYVLFIIKIILVRFFVFWFNDEIKEVRRLRCRVERRWWCFGLDIDFFIYKVIKNKINNLMNEVCRVFFIDFVEENCID